MRRILMPIALVIAGSCTTYAQEPAAKPDANANHATAPQPPLAQALVGMPIYSSDAEKSRTSDCDRRGRRREDECDAGRD